MSDRVLWPEPTTGEATFTQDELIQAYYDAETPPEVEANFECGLGLVSILIEGTYYVVAEGKLKNE